MIPHRPLAVALSLLAALWLAGCGDIFGERDPNGPPPSPALWEVTAPNGERGWLFGTIHALESGTVWRTRTFDRAFANSRALVLEVAALDDSAALGETFSRLSVTPGQGSVTSRVEPADRPLVRAALDRAGYGDGDFGALETWAVALTLASELGETGIGIDRQLLEMRDSRPVLGLETASAQYGAFDQLSPDAQSALLVAVVDESGKPEDRRARAEAWRLGRLDKLEQETHRGMLADPQVREALLTARNAAWIGGIETLVTSGREPFIAVGTGHLVGTDGVPALLEAAGYTLKRLQ